MTKQQIKEALDAVKEYCEERSCGFCYFYNRKHCECELENRLVRDWDTEKIAEVIADETD